MTFVPSYALQERSVSENPEVGPQGAGWKEEEAFTLEARSRTQIVSAPLTRKMAKGTGGPAGDECQNLIAAPLSHGSNPNSNAAGRRREDDENLVVANTLKSQGGRGWSHDAEASYVTSFHNTQDPISDPDVSLPLGRKTFGMGVAIPISGDALRGEGTAKTPSADAEGRVRLRDPGMAIGEDGDPAFTLSATSPGAVSIGPEGLKRQYVEGEITAEQLDERMGPALASVRRLMPVECERLQALPDGWTDLGGTADSKRYAALGDAVTASVAEWIGGRLLHA